MCVCVCPNFSSQFFFPVFVLQEATVILSMLLSRYDLVPAPGAQPIQPVIAGIMETAGLSVLCSPLC